ncbi:MAG: NAD-dependent succinate-semialdehyde dehydrogenase [Actinobacteria bacterium]|nr:NAD-dependent succinate-semialdehyde dehydrogenase [Actinomycetota bacterium]
MADYAVVDPATGSLIKEYPTIGDADLDSAVARAHAARGPWGSGTTVAERAAIIRRVGQLHEERKQELGEIISREMGKPVAQAIGEVEFSAAIYEYYADNAEKFLADEPIELLAGEGTAVIRRSPVGVLLGIMPWNFPYYQVARFAGPNLIIGNTILLKHAPQCPESAAAMEQMFRDAGVPADAYINIYATNDQVSKLIADPRVQGISLTGSGRAGAAVAEQAGRHLKKVVLELGGSDPFILLGTDDMDATVEAAVAARMDNAGQACNAAKRFIVVEGLYDEFVEKFTAAVTSMQYGDPTAEDTAYGPLSSKLAADRLEEQVKAATADGAELVGGARDGNFVQGGVLTNVAPGNSAYGQELFGPIAQVYKAADEAEAVRLANDTEYGLGSYVFTNDPEQASRVADQIEAGMVFVNCVGADGVELPFGGIKASGFGRELGRYGMEEFVNKKLIRVNA